VNETPNNTPRLNTLLQRVRVVFLNQPNQALSLAVISGVVGTEAQASVSARIRDLRKQGMNITVKRLYAGKYMYTYHPATQQVL
jgi:biotin operon repressor